VSFFILKPFQLDFLEKTLIYIKVSIIKLIVKALLGLLDFSDLFFLGFRVV